MIDTDFERLGKQHAEHALIMGLLQELANDRRHGVRRRSIRRKLALYAYEVARGWDRRRAPDPERLREELGRRMGAAPAARGGARGSSD